MPKGNRFGASPGEWSLAALVASVSSKEDCMERISVRYDSNVKSFWD